MKTLVTRPQVVTASILSAIFGTIGSAFAATTVADLWTAFDVSSINAQVLAILITFVTINLAFLAYRYIRRTMSKG